MKKLYLTCLLLIAPSLCFAFGPAIQAVLSQTSPPVGGSDYCNACPDEANGADVFCEDCHTGAATGLCEWTKVEAGGATGTISFAANPDNDPALSCTDIAMTNAIQILKTNTTAGATYAYKDFTESALYIQFYVKIAAEGLADDGLQQILVVDNGTNTTLWFRLYQVSGALKFNLLFYDNGWRSDTGGTNISTDTWYGVRIHLNNPAGGGSDSVQWWVDYTNDGTWTNEGSTTGSTCAYTTTRLNIGHIENSALTHSVFISGLKVDNDTMPTECAR